MGNVSENPEQNLSEAARRAYEAARLAFASAPTVEAHAWRGTLATREVAGESSAGEPAVSSAAAPRTPAAQPASPYARSENEDDDGYDPWSDRREEPAFWEADPWR